VQVLVLPVCSDDARAAEQAAEAINGHFSVYVGRALNPRLLLNSRSQVLAEPLLEELGSLRLRHCKLLGVTEQDITTEGTNYVFGLAELGGRAAVLSTFRLRCSERGKFRERLLKEALHELGHTFGLVHCTRSCVMRFSADVHGVDAKPASFCSTCMSSLTKFQSLADRI